ncbi:tRNA (adenosine(37)-N6)-threonylcarbamoyltransferase complex dimerization subunit type 1 TsaB [Flagellimonas sp.]|uniref:tRNA (adenosine(37)-N6)-threonylcarbamoyltransferase complex dimerization subunit type 1 TsaB n=1 Tax=Flagellimonas sp. TaxID=2058762 RepID=UPI003F4A8335
MARILNLETATTNCSVSISENEKTILLKENNAAEYSHSEQLHVFIKEALDEASLSFLDLDAVSVSKGPGSYTGLRIGVSAAKGLCFSLDIPLIAVATLESMARQVKLEENQLVIPVLDARRMEVYSAVYDENYQEIRETKAEVVEVSSFQDYLSYDKVYMVGSGASKCKETLQHSNFIFDETLMPSASEMAVIAHDKYQKEHFEDVAYFEPYYLKDFVLQGKKTNP